MLPPPGSTWVLSSCTWTWEFQTPVIMDLLGLPLFQLWGFYCISNCVFDTLPLTLQACARAHASIRTHRVCPTLRRGLQSSLLRSALRKLIFNTQIALGKTYLSFLLTLSLHLINMFSPFATHPQNSIVKDCKRQLLTKSIIRRKEGAQF